MKKALLILLGMGAVGTAAWFILDKNAAKKLQTVFKQLDNEGKTTEEIFFEKYANDQNFKKAIDRLQTVDISKPISKQILTDFSNIRKPLNGL